MTTEQRKIDVGLTAGFHYGTIYAPCNGVLHWTDELHSDGRQVAICDACDTKTVLRNDDNSRLARAIFGSNVDV